MNTDLISVIVPVYNAEEYLHKCLDSLVAQTYRNLQIILVDDGSTDNSGKICDEYAERDDRIEVYHQGNAGQANARNTALQQAKGLWIGFMDNDDTLDPYMYERLWNNAIRYDVLVSGCATLTVKEDGTSYNTYSDLESGVYNSEKFILAILYQTKYAWGSMWNKIWHASLKDELYFPDGMQLEDYWVSLKILREVKKVYFDKEPMYRWFYHSSSQSHKSFDEQKVSIMIMSKKISDYFDRVGSQKEKRAGNYFDFISRVGVINLMVKTRDKTIVRQSKEYINDTWKVCRKIKLNSDIPVKSFVKNQLILLRTMIICLLQK